MSDTVRVDKWLWAVRLYKTRSLAAESVRLGRITMAGQEVKPSRLVKIGDTLHVQQPDLVRVVKIKATCEQRMAAKFVPDFLEDITPPEAIERAQKLREDRRLSAPVFADGLVRPTKHERRELDHFLSQAATAAQLEDSWDQEASPSL